MIPTQVYIDAFRRIAKFKIKYKSESSWQKILAFFVRWYIPTYLTHYTTVIGRSIYFPNERLVNHPSTRFTIAHEVVHILDQKRLSTPIFILLYLFPQIFALGVLSFPWLEWHALWFLLFGLPWPSWGRSYLEGRAYGLELYLYTISGYKIADRKYVDIFVSPDYYYMSWSRRLAEQLVIKYYNLAQSGTDEIFQKVIDTFDGCDQNSAAS